MITLNEEARIVSDKVEVKLQVMKTIAILDENKKPTGDKRISFVTISHCSNIANAITSYLRYKGIMIASREENVSLKEAIQELTELRDSIIQSFKNLNQIGK